MKIQIDYIAKIEGHAGFVADIIKGDVKKARLEVDEGARLIEGILVGRHFDEAPTITSRICGVCPVVHTLTSIKALEETLNIQPSRQTITLRKLLMAGQLINSHCAHLFLFSLADFFNAKNDLLLFKKNPQLLKNALRLRDFGNNLIEVIGGRMIHPLTPTIGGFRKLPDIKNLKNLYEENKALLPIAEKLMSFVAQLNYPLFERRNAYYISFYSPEEYAIYDGKIKTGASLKKPKNFISEIKEYQLAESAIKSTKFENKTFMVGPLARLNNNYQQLNPIAQKILKKSGIKLPCPNPFYNILAQAVEIMHSFEESEKILSHILKTGLKYEHRKQEGFAPKGTLYYNYEIGVIKAGQGLGAMEAPRGTLYHYYEIDNNGIIKNCNIITPTAQNLSRLEDDFLEYLPALTRRGRPQLQKLNKKQREDKIKMLVRAYDPCLTCATH